jgi:hypothetical protein
VHRSDSSHLAFFEKRVKLYARRLHSRVAFAAGDPHGLVTPRRESLGDRHGRRHLSGGRSRHHQRLGPDISHTIFARQRRRSPKLQIYRRSPEEFQCKVLPCTATEGWWGQESAVRMPSQVSCCTIVDSHSATLFGFVWRCATAPGHIAVPLGAIFAKHCVRTREFPESWGHP